MMEHNEVTKILDQLSKNEIKEFLVKKEDFLSFRQVLVNREDFKHFRGIACHGGDVIYTYIEIARS